MNGGDDGRDPAAPSGPDEPAAGGPPSPFAPPPPPGPWQQPGAAPAPPPPPAPPVPPAPPAPPGEWQAAPPAGPPPGQWQQPPAPPSAGYPPAGPPPGYPPGGYPPAGAPGGPLPQYTQSAVVERKGFPFLPILVVFAAFAVLACGAFGYMQITKKDGAETPEAAVRSFFDAVQNEDAVGILQALPPSERDVLKQPVTDIVSELQRLGVLKQFELTKVPGADVQVQGLTLTTESVGSNTDLSAVKVTGGTISAKVVPDAVPLGDRLRKIITEDIGGTVDIKAEEEREDLAKAETRIITVKEAGGWHVSLNYSIAEAARGNRGTPPVLGNAPKPVGSASPEGALRDLSQAVLDLDFERVIGMLPPDEMRALYDYAPTFLPDLRKDADEAKKNGYTAKIVRLETRVDGSGGIRKVITTGFEFTIDEKDSNLKVTFDGACYRTEQKKGSRTTNAEFCPGKAGTGSSELERTFNEFGVAKTLTTPEWIVVERDGRWYLSPTRTMLGAVVDGLKKVTPQDVEAWGKAMGKDAANPTTTTRPPSSITSTTPSSITTTTRPGTTSTTRPGTTTTSRAATTTTR